MKISCSSISKWTTKKDGRVLHRRNNLQVTSLSKKKKTIPQEQLKILEMLDNPSEKDQLPQGFWIRPKNQRLFLDWLSKRLDFKSMDDWYSISEKTIIQFGGCGLFNRYKRSPSKMLSSVYNEHSWNLWKFEHTPRGFWNQIENQKNYLDWLAGQLHIQR